MFRSSSPFSEEDLLVSYLPLSHVAGLLFDVLNQINSGCTVYFARPDALQGSLVLTLLKA